MKLTTVRIATSTNSLDGGEMVMGYKVKGLLDTAAMILASISVYLIANGQETSGIILGAFVAGFKVFIEKLAEGGIIEKVGAVFKFKKK